MLELRNVHKHYGKTPAALDVSLRLEKGEFFCLLGPSGCGKSTILRMVAGFERQDSGRILLDGCDISDLPPYRRDVNMVFQSYALFPHMDVAANVAYGLRIRGLPGDEIRDRVAQGLALVGLPDHGNRTPAQLSGGQKQRVALARALVNGPSVLLLDEPMSALDQKIAQQMRRELKELQQKVGTTFVYVTHNQTEALTLSDRMAVMDAGRVEHTGTPREVYETPATRFTASFIGQMNFFPGRVVDTRDEEVHLELFGHHPVILTSGEPATPGEEVTFCLRPERLKLGLVPPQPYENALQGEILGATYMGETTAYDIRLEGGATVTVQAQNYLAAMGEGFFAAGDPVHVLWSRTSGRLVRG